MIEWSFPSNKTTNQMMRWSKSGLLAVASGDIISIYNTFFPENQKNNSKLTLKQSFSLNGEEITAIEWCDGPDKIGKSHNFLAICSKIGSYTLYDIDKLSKIFDFTLSHDYALSIKNSPFSNEVFFIGTNNSKIQKYKINYENDEDKVKLVWEIKTRITPNFLEANVASSQRHGRICT